MVRKFCVLAWLMMPMSAYADLPLSVEDLLTAQNRWRFDLGAVYANSERVGAQNGQMILVQTGPASFVSIPTFAGSVRENTDTVIVTPGVRYGVGTDTELYMRSSWLSSTSRFTLNNSVQTQSVSQFADAWVGVNHRLIREDNNPALLGFAELALSEKRNGNVHNAKSALFGFTSYRTTEPLVLALTAAYRFNTPYSADGVTYRGGNFLLINPSVSFAVSPVATLVTGVAWRRLSPEVFNGVSQGAVLTRTDFSLGLGYSYDERTTIHTTLRGNLSGGNGAEFGVTASFKLGDLLSPN